MASVRGLGIDKLADGGPAAAGQRAAAGWLSGETQTQRKMTLHTKTRDLLDLTATNLGIYNFYVLGIISIYQHIFPPHKRHSFHR